MVTSRVVAKKKSASARKNISRFDFGRSHGWWVRFERAGETHSKFFADTAWGGRATALLAAESHRDDLLATLPARRLPPNARPGPGRIFSEQRRYKNARGERVGYQAWIAWIRIAPGKVASTSYAVKRYGRAAKKMAAAWLAKKRREQRANYAQAKKDRQRSASR